jgi:TPR repeat protein
MMQGAAVLGNKQAQAQVALGEMYRKSTKVARDTNRAKRYFRLCAASGTAECQFQLASLLLRSEQHSEQDQIQAVAWLELAESHDFIAARSMDDSEAAKLTPEHVRLVARLNNNLNINPEPRKSRPERA